MMIAPECRRYGVAFDELERRRLEALEPGITQLEWGPNGEVLMPGHLPTRPGEL